MKNYLMIITCLIILGCEKQEDIIIYDDSYYNSDYGNNDSSSPEIYFTGSIDNVQHNYSTNSSDIQYSYGFGYGSSFNPCNSIDTSHTHSYGSSITRKDTTYNPIISLSKQHISYIGDTGAPDSTFYNFFGLGNYTFAHYSNQFGFQLTFYDSNGKKWRTDYGTANQQNSSISIINVDKMDDPSEIYVLISFNCTLYDTTGNSIEVTNAVYYGKFKNFEH